jgi:site-specific DNA recombinase
MKKLETVALIYTRVSTSQQESDGTGNHSQETRCRDFAEKEGLNVEKVFTDVFSGGGDFLKRPAMRDLLNYLQLNYKNKKYVIIFDDLKRFARDTEFHIRLRATFKNYNVDLKCLNYKFEDSPEGRFMETIFAAGNQLDREQNQRQVMQKQTARLRDGYYPFPALYGYNQVKIAGHGKLSVPNEFADYVKEALEGYSFGRFKSPTEVGRFLYEKKVVKCKDSKSHTELGTSMLMNLFYVGIINFPEREINMVQGKHRALISFETYYKNAKRLSERPKHREKSYEVYKEQFELRQIARCSLCNTKLDSYTTRKYKERKLVQEKEYYDCKNKNCDKYSKVIPADEVHLKFRSLLRTITPNEKALSIFTDAYYEAYEEFKNELVVNEKYSTQQKSDTQNQIDQLLETVLKTTSPKLKSVYEEKIERLVLQLEELDKKKIEKVDTELLSRTSLERMNEVVKSPYNIWIKLNAKQKREFYYFIFTEDFYIQRNTESRTPQLSEIYLYLQAISENMGEEFIKTPDKWKSPPLGRTIFGDKKSFIYLHLSLISLEKWLGNEKNIRIIKFLNISDYHLCFLPLSSSISPSAQFINLLAA